MSKVHNVVLGCGLLLAIPSGSSCDPSTFREYPFELAEPREVFVKVLRTDTEPREDAWQLRFSAQLQDGSVRDLGTLSAVGGTPWVSLPAGRHTLRIEGHGAPDQRWDVLLVEAAAKGEGSGGHVNPSTHWDHAAPPAAGCTASVARHRAGDEALAVPGLATVLAAYLARRSHAGSTASSARTCASVVSRYVF